MNSLIFLPTKSSYIRENILTTMWCGRGGNLSDRMEKINWKFFIKVTFEIGNLYTFYPPFDWILNSSLSQHSQVEFIGFSCKFYFLFFFVFFCMWFLDVSNTRTISQVIHNQVPAVTWCEKFFSVEKNKNERKKMISIRFYRILFYTQDSRERRENSWFE